VINGTAIIEEGGEGRKDREQGAWIALDSIAQLLLWIMAHELL
jgi:hypothetical protein